MERKFIRGRLYNFTWLVIAIVTLLSGYSSIYYYSQSTDILRKAEDSYKLSNEVAKDRSIRCNSLFGNNPKSKKDSKDEKDINKKIIEDKIFMQCYDDVFDFQKSSFVKYYSDLKLSGSLLRKAIFFLIIALVSPVAYLMGLLIYKYLFPSR